MFKLIRKLLLLVIIICAFLATKNVLAKYIFQFSMKQATNMELELGRFDLGLKSTYFSARDVDLLNPEGFDDIVLADFDEVYVDYDPKGILKGIIHLNELRIDMKQVLIVRNEEGEVNIVKMGKILSDESNKKNEGGFESSQEDGRSSNKSKFKVDHLVIKIGNVLFKDNANKDPKKEVKFYELNIYEKFENVTSVEELSGLIIQRILTKTLLANLANLDIDFINGFSSNSNTENTVKSFKEKVQSLKEKIPLGSN